MNDQNPNALKDTSDSAAVDLSIPFNIALVSDLKDIGNTLKARGLENLIFVGESELVIDGKAQPIWRAGKERGLAISRAVEKASTGNRPVTLVLQTEAGWVDTLIESAKDHKAGSALTSAIWSSVENSLVGFGTLRRRQVVFLKSGNANYTFPVGWRLPQSWVTNHPTRAERTPNKPQRETKAPRQASFHESLFLAIKGHFDKKLKGSTIPLLPHPDLPIGETVLGAFICASTGNENLTVADYNRVLHSVLVAMTNRPYWNNMEAQRDMVLAGSVSPQHLTVWLIGRILLAEKSVMNVEPIVDPASRELWLACHAAKDIERIACSDKVTP